MLIQKIIMEWIKFDESYPTPLVKLLWLDINECWFEGKLVDDTDYGICISTFDEYVPIDQITHYMIIELPK